MYRDPGVRIALVRWRTERQEACSKERVDRSVVKILVLVTAYMRENRIHRKHKVFFATLVSGELVDPKSEANN